ncbi:nucleotidyltransferase domain-containing protein [Clostridium botulinum]|uniref:nucleotidyltransferase domain-containing protein n=1 Tax=Clostridium botulinum TaxID=1491 RepID=UPI0009B226B2|nr:nucleotidyltransferase domain-containing protein [Clostridium botulinum]MBY6809210.1 nucleotidyltransferase domain-containing protein [Clostridium botulinum]MBY6822652.1 nucleotidyltransferase domain-containing protein [Clostridium botulinum]MBY6833264.1 nucleotidyltransferase domain-containing protein [Clostridium botulinum]MBY6935471.1 nucleotidyltransferase domain-containing protein [Clostridium botulinum]MBY6971325.1 nucleotidyltransferase domain-containing protein [Clostridium botulinu
MNLDIEIINSIQDICKRYNFIEKVIIFGSRARGDNDVKSDIDIAVYSKKPILEFIEDVEMNTRTLLEFDFSHMNSIQDEFFVEQVTKEGIIIYEKC